MGLFHNADSSVELFHTATRDIIRTCDVNGIYNLFGRRLLYRYLLLNGHCGGFPHNHKF